MLIGRLAKFIYSQSQLLIELLGDKSSHSALPGTYISILKNNFLESGYYNQLKDTVHELHLQSHMPWLNSTIAKLVEGFHNSLRTEG